MEPFLRRNKERVARHANQSYLLSFSSSNSVICNHPPTMHLASQPASYLCHPYCSLPPVGGKRVEHGTTYEWTSLFNFLVGSRSLSLSSSNVPADKEREERLMALQPPPKFSSSYFLCSINIAPSSLCLVRSNHFLFIDSWLLSRLLLYWHYFCYMHALGKREFVCLFSQSELFVAAFLFLLSLRLLLPFHKSRPAIFLMYSIEGKEATRLRSLAVTAST